MIEQKSDLEKYFAEQEKRFLESRKEIENLQYKQILYELLTYLRFYYEKQMIQKKENNISKLEMVGDSEIKSYFMAEGYMFAYMEMVGYLKDKIPREMLEFLCFNNSCLLENLLSFERKIITDQL